MGVSHFLRLRLRQIFVIIFITISKSVVFFRRNNDDQCVLQSFGHTSTSREIRRIESGFRTLSRCYCLSRRRPGTTASACISVANWLAQTTMRWVTRPRTGTRCLTRYTCCQGMNPWWFHQPTQRSSSCSTTSKYTGR